MQKPLALLLCGLCLSFLFTGCAGTQVVDSTSGSGFKGSVAVPIPLSGGSTLIGANLIVGAWKNSTIVQPVSSNTLYTANLAINQATHGAQNLSGTAGTNGAAGIVAGESDYNSIVTGASSVTATNAVLQGQPK